MKLSFRALVLFSAAMMLCSPASAEEQKRAGVCSDDIHTYCGSVQRGGGRIVRCLLDHKTEVSPECYAAAQRVQQEMKEQGTNGSSPSAK